MAFLFLNYGYMAICIVPSGFLSIKVYGVIFIILIYKNGDWEYIDCRDDGEDETIHFEL